MYKPQYLNVERVTDTTYFYDDPIPTVSVSTTKLGYKKKPPEDTKGKLFRRFIKKGR